MQAEQTQAIAATRLWLERAVIGLNLCPFANAVHLRRQIRWVVSPARTRPALSRDLTAELQHLAAADPARTDTTLLIHPLVLRDFDRYNEYLDAADALLRELQLDGVLQIASFHPRYRFEGAPRGDVANASNRSPYPMLHLLREASIERAVRAFPDASAIFDRNIDTLRRLGWRGWHALLEVDR